MTTISRIEASVYNSTLTVNLVGRSVTVNFTRDTDGNVVLNSDDFQSLITADDISLSRTEIADLEGHLEQIARGE